MKYKPVFCDEAEESLMETWVEKVQVYLEGLSEHQKTVGSKTVKKAVDAEGIAPSTWKRIAKQEYPGWTRAGQSFVRLSAEYYNLDSEEDAA